MFRITIIMVVLVVFATACNQSNTTETTTTAANDTVQNTTQPVTETKKQNLLIIPGESVGELNLGDDAAVINTKLGNPDSSDAAMGKAWMTWYSKQKDEHNNLPELNVFTTYKDTSMKQKTVQLIRTTSPDFTTSDSVRLYITLPEIAKVFPKLTYRAHFQLQGKDSIISIYDDQKSGIAFDISVVNEKKVCTGIIIHPKNKNVMDHYLTFLQSHGWMMTNEKVK